MRGFVLSSVAIIVLAIESVACITIPQTFTVSPKFAVHVSNNGHPVVGLKLRASVDYPEVATDNEGMAYFELPPGGHTLIADHPIGGVYAELVVKEGATVSVIDLVWPEHQALQTTSISGTINYGVLAKCIRPMKDLEVTLHKFVSLQELAATVTAPDGSFSLANVPQGLYILRVKEKGVKVLNNGSWDPADESSRVRGDIPVEVVTDGALKRLILDVSYTTCGLYYETGEEQAKKSTGRVRCTK